MNQQNQTFEQNMLRLEQIVRAMERGDVALEESLKLFQEGTGLVKSCDEMLSRAELEVVKLMKGADGAPGTPGTDGKDGSPGATPNLQIGTVTTLPAASDATASMGGTAENPTLNLGIPKGADGAPGLPTVTAEDNGKFLRVVNGAWAAAEIASAGGVSF